MSSNRFLYCAPVLLGLNRWYEQAARPMPWRSDPTPWRVWVSEIMLQQTRVDTVAQVYDEFLMRFPTVASMAASTEDDVLAQWAGLGYYRRARLLHRGAQQIIASFDGTIPSQREELLTISGIGDYTASAIASIAYGRPHLPVDGNVARISARLSARKEAKRPLKSEEQSAWDDALSALKIQQIKQSVQAFMEVGSTICVAQTPRCLDCPINAHCAVGQQVVLQAITPQDAGAYGRTKPKAKPKPLSYRAYVVSRGNQILVVKRPDGLLGGQWALPLQRVDQDWVLAPQRCALIEHVFTHQHWTVEVGHCIIDESKIDDQASIEAIVGSSDYRWQPISHPMVAKAFQKMLDS